MTTPNAAELRAADAADKAIATGGYATSKEWRAAELNAQALAIRSSLHLDEVREAIARAESQFDFLGEQPRANEMRQALKFLSE